MPHIVEKFSTRATTLLYTSSQSNIYRRSYEASKLWESQFKEFQDCNLGVPEQNDIWLMAPWPGTKNIIRGKVAASPKFGPWWVLWIYVCHGSCVHQKCSSYALTNLLFNLCRFVWIIDPLVTHPSPHPKTPTHPSTPEVFRTKESAPTHYPSIIFTLNSHLKLSRSLGMRHIG